MNRRKNIQTMAEMMQQRAAAQNQNAGYESFSAAELYCPKCKQSMPVREKMLLFVGTGELYDYCCSKCGTSLGTRKT